jgi:hypothetical protein
MRPIALLCALLVMLLWTVYMLSAFVWKTLILVFLIIFIKKFEVERCGNIYINNK